VDLQLYGYDAYLEERKPDAVAFVHTTEEVAGVVRACNKHGAPFVPRGGGTNLKGIARRRKKPPEPHGVQGAEGGCGEIQ